MEISRDFNILSIAFGQESWFTSAEMAVYNANIGELAKLAAGDSSDNVPRLLDINGDVAIITISGGLTNRSSYWNRLFGLVAYSEIREAIYYALEEGVASILFMYDTPGGSATGVTDIAETIASINIPTISYAYGNMCSAGYLLGSQSDEMYCDRFSMVGDIGVKISFMDYSKYLAEAKITPVRFRSGDLKGAGDQKFSLSKKEKAYIQETVDHMAEVFYEIVSEARGVPVDYLHKSGITDGRSYVGTQSLEVGLVDGVKTFEEVTLLAIEKAEKFLDRSAGQGLYGS